MAISYNKLWKLLIDKGMTKTDLRKSAGVTTNVIAKLGRNESVQLETLMKFCAVLDCGMDDIVEIISEEKEGGEAE